MRKRPILVGIGTPKYRRTGENLQETQRRYLLESEELWGWDSDSYKFPEEADPKTLVGRIIGRGQRHSDIYER